jgi:hypothetical protein
MNAEIAIEKLLSTDATVRALTTRVYYDEAEQSAVLPYIIINVDDIIPNDTQTGVSTLDFDNVTVTIFTATEREGYTLANTVLNALDRVVGTYNGIVVESITFNDQSKRGAFLIDKPGVVISQSYQVMTTQ